MPRDTRGDNERRRDHPVANLQERIAVRREIGREVIALTHLVGRPVLDVDGRRVGRLDDVVVEWTLGARYPTVAGILVKVGKGLALVAMADLTLEQRRVHLGTPELSIAKPVRHEGLIALARDVLDHQLVDVQGIQVVRASDVYLVRKEESWELGGVDVGLNAFLRRLLPKARKCPPPHKAIDWVHLQTFVPPTSHEGPDPTTRTAAAGAVGGGLQLGTPAKDIQRLRAKEVASILSDLGRREGAQVASLVAPATAAQALRHLPPRERGALLAALSEPDRARLLSLLEEAEPQ